MKNQFPLVFAQLSFSTTATTIVSGAMAERTKLSAYIIFSLVNTLIYCVPAHWVWAENGFLLKVQNTTRAPSAGPSMSDFVKHKQQRTSSGVHLQ